MGYAAGSKSDTPMSISAGSKSEGERISTSWRESGKEADKYRNSETFHTNVSHTLGIRVIPPTSKIVDNSDFSNPESFKHCSIGRRVRLIKCWTSPSNLARDNVISKCKAPPPSGRIIIKGALISVYKENYHDKSFLTLDERVLYYMHELGLCDGRRKDTKPITHLIQLLALSWCAYCGIKNW